MRRLPLVSLFFVFVLLIIPKYLSAQGTASEESLGKLFIQSIQDKQFRVLTNVLVPIEVYVAISPEEVSGKSKAELAKLQKIVEGRLKSKWSILLTEAKFYKVKTAQLRFLSVSPKDILFQNTYLSGLEVVAGYQQKTFNFLLIVVQVDDIWYLLDIAQQSNVFER